MVNLQCTMEKTYVTENTEKYIVGQNGNILEKLSWKDVHIFFFYCTWL